MFLPYFHKSRNYCGLLNDTFCINAYAANYGSQSFRGMLMLNFIRDNIVYLLTITINTISRGTIVILSK